MLSIFVSSEIANYLTIMCNGNIKILTTNFLYLPRKKNNNQIINGKYVEGFYIYARQIDSANETYKMLTVLNGGGASTCTVTSLLKYTLYEFFIVPFYKTVEGKPSNSRISRTLEDGKYIFFGCYFRCPKIHIFIFVYSFHSYSMR